MLKHYNLRSTFCVLGPYRAGGYGAEGGITIGRSSDFAEVQTSADGVDSVINHSNDDVWIVEIVFGERSKAYADFGRLAKAQETARKAGTPIPDWPFSLDDTINGDSANGPRAAFLAVPEITKRSKAGERTFRIAVPDCEVVFGALNVV